MTNTQNEAQDAHDEMVAVLKEKASHAGSVKHRGVKVIRQRGLRGVDKIHIRLYDPRTEQAGGGTPDTPLILP